MKLNNLVIQNFRCFELLSIDLDEQMTVLVAKNGQGKTAILDAVRIGLWPFVSGFDLAKNPVNSKENNINIDDVRIVPRLKDGTKNHDSKGKYNEMLRQLPCNISLEGFSDIRLVGNDRIKDKHLLSWTLFRDSESKGSKPKSKNDASLKLLAIATQSQIRNPKSPDINLPIICYYGTSRRWILDRVIEDKNSIGKLANSFYMRLFGYRDCLDSSSSYKHFVEWFTWVYECYREDLIKKAEKGSSSELNSVWKDTILVVQQAIDKVLHDTGWHSLEYSVSHEKSLVLNHLKYGTLKVGLLSDGIRGILAMVGDIAYRCIKLNPHLGLNAAKEAKGVVMIDEIDMHLHPAWQQTILGSLTDAFPLIQFIVTTHSPQVISTVPSHQVRIIDGNTIVPVEAGTQGAESSRILKEIFGVDTRAQNLEIVQKLNRYLKLVDNDQWDSEEGIELRQLLNEWSNGQEPELMKADIDIRMKEFQRQL